MDLWQMRDAQKSRAKLEVDPDTTRGKRGLITRTYVSQMNELMILIEGRPQGVTLFL